MGDSQRVRFRVAGTDEWRVVPRAEFDAYVRGLSSTARRRLEFPEGNKHDSVYTNTEGEQVRESLSGDQIIRRMDFGEQALVTGADDPKLQNYNRQQQAEAREAVAEEEQVVAMFDAINPTSLIPGVSHLKSYLENKALGGEEEVARIRGEISSANRAEQMFGSMALGFGAGGAAMGVLRGMGVTAKTGRGLGLAAHIAADEAAFETARYTKYVIDNRQDWQAEELAANIGAGIMFAAPVVGGALLRKPVWNALKMAGGGVGNVAGHAQSALVAASFRAGDAAQASKLRRAAAIMGIGRRTFGGRKMVTKADELAETYRIMQKEEGLIGRGTPEKLRGAKAGKGDEILDAIRKNMDEPAGYLDDIDYNGMARDLGGLRKAHVAASKELGRVPRNMKVGKVKGVGRLGKTAQDTLDSTMDTFLGRAESLGYDDFVGHLRDLKGADNYGRLFQARLDLAMKAKQGRHSTGILADELKAITEDPRIWGTGKAGEQARNINDAIDGYVRAHDDLQAFGLPDDLSKIPDNINYEKMNDAVAKLRESMDRLHASGLASFDQVRALAGKLDDIEDALIDGGRATLQAKKLNKARRSAALNHKKRFEQVKSGDVETANALEARMAERAGQWSKARTGLIKFGDRLVESGRIPVFTNRMMKNIRETSHQDKEEFFMYMQERIPMLTGNPEFMAREMEPFMIENPQNPEVHAMAGVGVGNGIYFLANKLGRVDRTLYGRDRKPRRDRVLRFFETFQAMQDPMNVAYAAMSGEVTQDMIDAIRITSPVQYNELSIVLSTVIDNADPLTLPRKSVAGINKFLGGADPLYSGEVIMQLQSNYAQNAEQQQAINGPQGGQPQGQFNQDHPQDGDNAFTFTQRLQSY